MGTCLLYVFSPYSLVQCLASPWKVFHICFLKRYFQKAQSKVLASFDMPDDLIWYCDFNITNVFSVVWDSFSNGQLFLWTLQTSSCSRSDCSALSHHCWWQFHLPSDSTKNFRVILDSFPLLIHHVLRMLLALSL